jgi:hypothetical protein
VRGDVNCAWYGLSLPDWSVIDDNVPLAADRKAQEHETRSCDDKVPPTADRAVERNVIATHAPSQAAVDAPPAGRSRGT